MRETGVVREGVEVPGCAASAAHPALPSLKKDNCIINGRFRAVFVTQENIRLYIQKFGESNVGSLTVTAADCLEASLFQRNWHSFINALKRKFPTGMWTRERQPRSGNWHAHAVVNVGWDIKTNFPREQVRSGFYANVDPRLRQLWKYLREKGESHGFGRIELLPLKYSGEVCARYLSKYLTKARSSDKSIGEEKGRLFSRWGGVCFVYRRFSFVSSRIVQKKKQWLAQELGYSDPIGLRNLSQHWWFHFGKLLCEVVFPADFYKVGPPDCRYFDSVGLRAYADDWPMSGEEFPESTIETSQLNLFYEIGAFLFGRKDGRALQYAMQIMAQPDTNNQPSHSITQAPAQQTLGLNPSIESEWSYAAR